MKRRRERYCTNVPKKKATATERKIPKMTDNAFSVFSRSANPSIPVSSPAILIRARTKVPPNSSNTMDTVVEVGIPKELKISNRTTSVTITARKIHINS